MQGGSERRRKTRKVAKELEKMEVKGLWRIKVKEGHLNAALLYPLKLQRSHRRFQLPRSDEFEKTRFGRGATELARRTD